MHFFSSMNAVNILGLVLLAVGAVLNFTANKLAKLVKTEKMDERYVPLIFKTIGLALVIVAFLMIIGIIG